LTAYHFIAILDIGHNIMDDKDEYTEEEQATPPETALATHTTPPLPAFVPIETLYDTIEDTLRALSHVTVSGEAPPSTLTPRLQAYNTKKYIPDTEIEMLHTSALPMADKDIKAFKEARDRRMSLKTRITEMRMPDKSLAEITGARIRVAYRLTRYMAHVRGLGKIGEPLIFTMAAANNQINLMELPIPYDPATGWYRGLETLRNMLADITAQDFTYTYAFTTQDAVGPQLWATKGMSILPPPLHDGYFHENGRPRWFYRQANYTPESYSPLSDGPLNAYLNMMEFLVRHLGIGESNFGQALEDEAAASALLNPKIARLAWPCRDDLETYEEYVLLPYVNRVAIEETPVDAIDELKKVLGLTHAEAVDYLETAKTYAEQAFVFDPQRERALMVNKLHALAGECNEAGMVTTQLNSMKTILQVLGLTKHQEDSNVDRRETLSSALEGEIINKSLPAGEAKELNAG
jgi:hypothetical protein